MENIIGKIIEIDEKALSIKVATEKTLIENEKKLKETLKSMEAKELNKAKKTAEDRYKSILDEAYKEASSIENKGDDKLQKLEKIYSDNQGILIEKIFNKIFEIK